MDVIPCKDCIVFAICNSKVKKLEGVYKTQFILHKIDRCSLIRTWIDRGPYTHDIKDECLKAFVKCFKIKYDVLPDTHLRRHLKPSPPWNWEMEKNG